MDYADVGPPPNIPPIHRPAPPLEDGGLVPQPFTPSNALVNQMPPFLRQYFANRHIERPANVSAYGQPQQGLYSGGRVQMDRSTNDPKVLRHELLHAISGEHPKYRMDQFRFYGGLRAAMGDGSYLPDFYRKHFEGLQQRGDWPHIFVHLGELTMDHPEWMPQGLQDYFAPLLPPVQNEQGPR